MEEIYISVWMNIHCIYLPTCISNKILPSYKLINLSIKKKNKIIIIENILSMQAEKSSSRHMFKILEKWLIQENIYLKL